MKYDIGGGDRGSDTSAQYFFVTPTTGSVQLKKLLTEDEGNDSQYRARRLYILLILLMVYMKRQCVIVNFKYWKCLIILNVVIADPGCCAR